ncbi:MAG: iron-containing alcohol dehydrogenase [Tenacibaculum sp.]
MAIINFKSAKRIIAGMESLSLLSVELHNLQIRQPLIVTDTGIKNSGILNKITSQLNKANYAVYEAITAEPSTDIVESCKRELLQKKYDGIIALGGGSVIDLAKVISVYIHSDEALTNLFGIDKIKTPRKVPLIAIPTTAGTGSEVTNIAVLSDTKLQVKKGIVSDYLLPDLALISPETLPDCPKSVIAASGIDALVHAIEAYLSNYSNPLSDALSIKAIKLIYSALPKVYSNPSNLNTWELMSTGSLLAGMAFGNAGVGAVHALAYPLGCRFHISHGVSNALLLPYVMEKNKTACIKRFADIAIALEPTMINKTSSKAADFVINLLYQICKDVEIPKGLRAFNIPRETIPEMAKDAIKIERLMKNNPRKLTIKDIINIYESAY